MGALEIGVFLVRRRSRRGDRSGIRGALSLSTWNLFFCHQLSALSTRLGAFVTGNSGLCSVRFGGCETSGEESGGELKATGLEDGTRDDPKLVTGEEHCGDGGDTQLPPPVC